MISNKKQPKKSTFWKEPANASDLLEDYFASKGKLNLFRLAQIREVWKDVVDEEFFRISKPVDLSRKNLIINVTGAISETDFNTKKEDIINLLSESETFRMLAFTPISREFIALRISIKLSDVLTLKFFPFIRISPDKPRSDPVSSNELPDRVSACASDRIFIE